MNILKTSIEENIKKNYSNKLCSSCNNRICKIYGGRCFKYNIKEKVKNILGGK